MRHVLHFWRDVEIFNIPDAPAPTRPGQSAALETEEADADDDGVEPGQPDALRRPRGCVVQRFPIRTNASPSALLPWQDARFQALVPTPETRTEGPALPASYAHAVYLGVAPKQKFVEFILRTHAMPASDDEQYRPASGDGWLAAFMVGDTGSPLKKTFVAASFAVGSSLLRSGHSLDLVSGELDLCRADFDERMEERRQLRSYDAPDTAPYPLEWQDLLGELDRVRRPLGLCDGADTLALQIVVKTVPLYRRKDGSLNPAPEQAATFLNSFFLDDLTCLLAGGPETYGSALTRYLGADSPADGRIDLLSDPALLASHVQPDAMPAGRWPSAPHQHLALAQQGAVYQIMHLVGQQEGERSRGLVAVNGPPGTGKTTLLKEVIAGVVVERARRISALSDPHALFDGTVQLGGGDQVQGPALRADLVDGSGIVVASSNNAAVQNISFELPFSCDLASFPGASYLSEAAAMMAENFKLPRRDPWGLVAGALGAKSNCDKLASALMGWEAAVTSDPASHPVKGKAASLKPRLDQARKQGAHMGQSEWQEAKRDFLDRLAVVDARVAELAALSHAMLALPEVLRRRDEVRRQLDAEAGRGIVLQRDEEGRQAGHARAERDERALLDRIAARRTAQELRHHALRERRRELRDLHQPGWLARTLQRLLGIETRAFTAWRDQLAEAGAALDASAAALEQTVSEHGDVSARLALLAQQEEAARRAHAAALDAAASHIAGLRQAAAALESEAAAMRARVEAAARGNLVIPDEAFLRLAPDQYHRRSLWVSERLERERSELFLAALRLHEASLMANAGSWFTLLRVVRAFLGGQEPRTPADRTAIWHALFFVVPVVSTTLASFGRLFDGMQQESLGWVLIDEAGQATVASVAGALWRARRAVLVGDPLQIEPVVTVPRALVDKLGAQNGMPGADLLRWSPSNQSAQTIADRTQAIGAWVGEVWTGLPLRTHRRCTEPMFTIANRIAYEDQMVQATSPLTVAPDFGPSCWIDVVGKASGKVVAEQINALRRILEGWLSDWPHIIDAEGQATPARVYVISPFRDVALECKELVDADSSLGRRLRRRHRAVDAGTVHTFQGKEAAIVFLVLGSAQGEAGAGSRRWAAAKPNLLNVALTRAQQRFYVIGNYADWAGLPYFAELAEHAGRMPRRGIDEVQWAGDVTVPQP